MEGSELRRRLDRLGITYTAAAARLGLTLAGLNHQMRGERPVSRQTELLLEHLETASAQPRRRRAGAPELERIKAKGPIVRGFPGPKASRWEERKRRATDRQRRALGLDPTQ
jgi:hypothetical protein